MLFITVLVLKCSGQASTTQTIPKRAITHGEYEKDADETGTKEKVLKGFGPADLHQRKAGCGGSALKPGPRITRREKYAKSKHEPGRDGGRRNRS